jgi:hypothetical protein
MVRVDPEAGERLLAKPHASAMEMRGRRMTGWIRVADEGIKTKRQLAAWVRQGVDYAGALPRKG